MGLLERTPDKDAQCSQMKATVVPDRSAQTLQSQVRANVETGSAMMTDEWIGYAGLDADYVHNVINHSVKYAEDNIHTNGAEKLLDVVQAVHQGNLCECRALPSIPVPGRTILPVQHPQGERCRQVLPGSARYRWKAVDLRAPDRL